MSKVVIAASFTPNYRAFDERPEATWPAFERSSPLYRNDLDPNFGAICVRLGDGGTLRTVGLDRAEIER